MAQISDLISKNKIDQAINECLIIAKQMNDNGLIDELNHISSRYVRYEEDKIKKIKSNETYEQQLNSITNDLQAIIRAYNISKHENESLEQNNNDDFTKKNLLRKRKLIILCILILLIGGLAYVGIDKYKINNLKEKQQFYFSKIDSVIGRIEYYESRDSVIAIKDSVINLKQKIEKVKELINNKENCKASDILNEVEDIFRDYEVSDSILFVKRAFIRDTILDKYENLALIILLQNDSLQECLNINSDEKQKIEIERVVEINKVIMMQIRDSKKTFFNKLDTLNININKLKEEQSLLNCSLNKN